METVMLMMPIEVAKLFRVNVRTVARWERQGKLKCIRTLGNHRRFKREEVMALYNETLGT